MPTTKEELPSTIARSSEKVQRTYAGALDSAHEQYDSEERAHRVAYAAVKHIAERKGDRWVLKDRPGPSDRQAEKSGAAARRGGKTAGGVNANKPKRGLLEDARKAGIEGRSKMNKEELAEALRKQYERETERARQRS